MNLSHTIESKIIRNKTVAFLFIVFIGITGLAQQNPQFSQYLQNPLVLNPAIIGAEDITDFTLGYRNQWTGFQGAPRTATLSFQSPTALLFSGKSNIDKSHSGIGAFIYTDDTGPINRSGYYLGYAYHLKASEEWYVSLGTFVGGNQFRFDESDEILIDNPNDILVQNFSTTSLDISAGLYIYSKHLFMGMAANQLLDNEISYNIQNGVLTSGKLNRNYNVLIGSRVEIDRDWTLIPAGVLKTVINAPVQWDMNVKAEYQNRLWGGISYRNKESVYALAGFRLWNSLSISYSYDYPISELRSNQSGSHEIVISYKVFGKGNNCGCAVNSL
ncbi:type IX secretion system membrane protein PorP/SprF [Aquimarina sp. U1-2]|uniref:PorP/SprF family type IX secretion system membrane protein n=1 Tax=Aquimarina sp. U1-2 TaxID=2823141 RepID=UPI001AEC79A9|nr:type IX secretion system membrane protein PorP/SprF [Aquimarina sp. U1-2]MBP2834100.1 type IX secretion system membrane protein PorP/SprF [Aquimarina sp. U1-2]